ncbi:hypothetical protein I2I05_13135 [Hymenobacter sp. BT683]|uniref:DUF4251 domain-containing protein n=1 Tax=Hymenobacter jeongseonensis TaxID=2791027 RepID=A0ABS0IKF1_9BACT|nr:hypothetical protein [Hymenobacter jeongseonensis]MBF9238343.1 hypothetical protein [Hymenobacter jeongseonensis]
MRVGIAQIKICCIWALLLVMSCTDESNSFTSVQIIEKSVALKIPHDWTERSIVFSSCDNIGEAYFGAGNDTEIGIAGVFINGFSVVMRRKPPELIENIFAKKLEEIKVKSRGPKIISTILNKGENSLTVDFTGKFYDNKPPFFFRYKLIIQGDEWVEFHFRGVDTPLLRKRINQVTQTIKVYQTPVKKRRKPCREIQI